MGDGSNCLGCYCPGAIVQGAIVWGAIVLDPKNSYIFLLHIIICIISLFPSTKKSTKCGKKYVRGGCGCDHMDLQLPVKSVPITTEIVSLNPVHGDVYSI